MSPSYQANVPIYLQIMMQFKRSIVAGEWQPGDRVPPVRELASTFEVNPNTMQRSLGELEREGILYSERTAGRFITRDASRIAALRAEMASRLVREFVHQFTQLGFTKQQIEQELAHYLEEEAGRQENNAAQDQGKGENP